MSTTLPAPRIAEPDDAPVIAQLLIDFNAEFDTPAPPHAIIEQRLRALLGGDDTFVVLGGDPPVSVAVVTLRPNVWHDGPVALLDEMYVVPRLRGSGIGSSVITEMQAEARRRSVSLVEINVDAPDVDAQRFYERHGFTGIEPDTGERAYYYAKELD